MDFQYDIIVVGAGHAGCEAAMAAANLGSSVLIITMDLNGIAKMSCNPAIGGIAKGQIIREIDALGGYSGIVTDRNTLQFRMLNRSKGPAMWSPRAQCDKLAYSVTWRRLLETHCKISIYADIAVSFSFQGQKVCGVSTRTGANFSAKAVILTAGTFLHGKLYIGQTTFDGGRIGEMSSYGLTEQLQERGIKSDRMKTGTPPRIDIRSIDLSKSVVQNGDDDPSRFSFLSVPSAVQSGRSQLPCFIFHTNFRVHEVLKSGFDQSPLFTGRIHGKGPRYCPSIEDKLRTFADKDSHQLFLEPEGADTTEYYLQGFSSSLPFDVQINALREIQGFENLKIFKPAYAVEYDFFDPTLLHASLESRVVENLFLAGQVNGTTGYEEAAAQGLVAGINAHIKINGKESFILRRDEAYIGVLIDDLITKGVDEPYRMFTSRAEYRILLRQDNADYRLTPRSYAIGLASESRYSLTMRKYDNINNLLKYTSSTSVSASRINSYLSSVGSSLLCQSKTIDEIVSRPGVFLSGVLDYVPHGTEEYYSNPEVCESAEIQIKYRGYIERERQQAEKLHRLENLRIPENFDFDSLNSLSIECRQKLKKYSPRTIAQASRISGVSPADISVLLVYFGR